MEAQSICGVIFKEFEDWNSQKKSVCEAARLFKKSDFTRESHLICGEGYVKILNNFWFIIQEYDPIIRHTLIPSTHATIFLP